MGDDPWSTNNYGDIRFEDSGGGGLTLNSYTQGGGWADMSFQNNGITKMFLESRGYLGIGTTAPVAPLHVTGGSDARPTGGGTIIVTGGGDSPGDELVLDGDEIMARDGNGQAAALSLNYDGGDVVVGGLLMALSDIDVDGSVHTESTVSNFVYTGETHTNALSTDAISARNSAEITISSPVEILAAMTVRDKLNLDGSFFVGRDSPVHNNEFFGVHSPLAGSAYGGMYISTEDAEGLPFYGYAPGKASQVWHYFDPAQDHWRVAFAGESPYSGFVIEAENTNTGIGLRSPRAQLHVNANSDAGPKGGGVVIVQGGGTDPQDELALDGNEIMARDIKGEPSAFGINLNGGEVHVGGPITALSSIQVDGDIVLPSPNGSVSASSVYTDAISSRSGQAIPVDHPLLVTGTDAGPTGGGSLIAQDGSGRTIAIDSNEIMATLNQAPAPLYLNYEGAYVQIGGPQTPADLNVYATVRADELRTGDSNANQILTLVEDKIMATDNGAASTLYLNHQGGDVNLGQTFFPSDLYVSGTVHTNELHISSGADLAERFEVNGPVAPGMLLSMDVSCPGALRSSAEAYDPKVIGIVSGANGLGAGVVLGDGEAPGQWPVALTGRAWAQCVSGDAGVEPGDLLTTSARPGYAMVVADRDRASGAVVGKAMSALEPDDEGLVLVFVNPQ